MEALKEGDDVSSWNDDRLDELSGRVDVGFAKVAERFDKIDEKFERLYHVLIAGMVVIVGALIGVPALGG